MLELRLFLYGENGVFQQLLSSEVLLNKQDAGRLFAAYIDLAKGALLYDTALQKLRIFFIELFTILEGAIVELVLPPAHLHYFLGVGHHVVVEVPRKLGVD